MSLQISGKEKPIVFILKLIYLIPVQLMIYPFGVIWLGLKQAGNPFAGLKSAWNDAKKWNSSYQ